MRLYLLLPFLFAIHLSHGAEFEQAAAPAPGYCDTFPDWNVVWDNFTTRQAIGPNLGISSSGYPWITVGVPGIDQTNNFQLIDGHLISTAPVHSGVVHFFADSVAMGVPPFTRIGANIRFRAGPFALVGNQVLVLEWWDGTPNFNSPSNLTVIAHWNGLNVFSQSFGQYELAEYFPGAFFRLTGPNTDIPFEASIVSNALFVTVGPYHYTVVNTNLHKWSAANRYAGFYLYGSANASILCDTRSVWIGWAKPEHWLAGGYGNIVNTNLNPGSRITYLRTEDLTNNCYAVKFSDQIVAVPSPSGSTQSVTNYLPDCWAHGTQPGARWMFYDAPGTASRSNVWFTTPRKSYKFNNGATITNYTTDNGSVEFIATANGYQMRKFP